MAYPDDDQFEDHEIQAVTVLESGGWEIRFDDALCFAVPADSPVEPTAGMTARMYGTGLGSRVRGLFLGGQEVYYRTKTEDDEQFEIDLYGADAADMLSRWDDGRTIHTIEMGGIGPGYEQAIQVTAMEILRHLLEAKYDPDLWEDKDVWARNRDAISGAVTPAIEGLGLSGAQWGAALNLATALYMRGPRQCLKEVPNDRHTIVSKDFPTAAAPA